MPERDPYALALAALGRKERTEAELTTWLGERGVEGEELRAVLLALAEEGAIDDERFARRYAEDKRELRGWGPERIAAALRDRGVGAEQIDTALAAEGVDAQVRRAAAALAERELGCESDAERARALGLLARRGFPSEVAYEAVRRRHGREAAGGDPDA